MYLISGEDGWLQFLDIKSGNDNVSNRIAKTSIFQLLLDDFMQVFSIVFWSYYSLHHVPNWSKQTATYLLIHQNCKIQFSVSTKRMEMYSTREQFI